MKILISIDVNVKQFLWYSKLSRKKLCYHDHRADSINALLSKEEPNRFQVGCS